jgi:hypothetical protein
MRSQVMGTPRARFWIETALGAVSAVLCLLTLVKPAWVEAAFGVDPDRGSGALEWALAAAFASAFITLGVLARAEWGRQAGASG